jgi:predicted phage baseplate assembly protein
VPPRYRPRLAQAPLTHAGGVLKAFADADASRYRRVAFDPDAPARRALRWGLAEVWPEIELAGTYQGKTRTWKPRRTLLASAPDAEEFVAEVDDEGRAHLRFGDDALGRRPDSGTTFTATYRVGNGAAGNAGAEAIAHVVTAVAGIVAVRNPLPAEGGLDPEGAESVRRRAPQAFRRQERAVTREDYAEVAGRFPGVQKAAAALRWTGSWHTVFTTVDLENGGDPTAELRTDLGRHIDRYRMAGHDLEVRAPIHVPLELHLHVCVKPAWFRDDVRRGLLDRLGNRILRDGRRGHFHPDRFSFGDPVYLSGIYAAAHAVPGVDSIEVKVFRRQDATDSAALAAGRIDVTPFEIARLDNDASHPERGVLRLELHGGK